MKKEHIQNDAFMVVKVPFSMSEREAFSNYARSNGLKMGQLLRRLALQEVQTKSTVLSEGFTVPKVSETLIVSKR